MKYDVIVELESKGLIKALGNDEKDALRKLLKDINKGPRSVDKDGLLCDGKYDTKTIILDNGRLIKRGSELKNNKLTHEAHEVSIEIMAGGVINIIICKYNEQGYHTISFRTSIKSPHVSNEFKIIYYDREAVSYIPRNILNLPELSFFEKVGIVPDKEIEIFLPQGAKGKDEIIAYANIALKNPNESYNNVVHSLAANERIGANKDSNNAIYLDENSNIIIDESKQFKKTHIL